jgi:hypothetical protein
VKKLGILIILLLIPSFALAQLPQLNFQYAIASATTTTEINVTGRGINYYRLNWATTGNSSPSACTITLEYSDNAFNWSTGITGDCTTDNISSYTGIQANYVRLNMTSYTATSAGASMIVNMIGWISNPASSGGGGGNVNIYDSAGGTLVSDNATHALKVYLVNGGAGGTSQNDNTAFTAGTTAINPGGCYYNVTQGSITSGRVAAPACNINRATFVQLQDSSKNELGTAGSPIRTDPTGSTTQPISGTITANAGTNLNTSLLALETGGNLASILGRFPATAALADNLGNPTVTGIGANLLGWDSSNAVWRRVQVDTGTGTIKVDPGTVAVTGTFFQATQPVSCANAATCPVNASQVGGPWTQNVTQFGSSNIVTGTGTGGSGIPRVTVSNDSNVLATESGTWTMQPGNTANTTAWLTYNGDPCQNPANTLTTDTLSFASSTVQKLITKTSAKKNYLCAIYVQAQGTAETWSILEGTKVTNECDTSTAALSGSTTAANGNASGANGGVSWGNGNASVIRGKTANNDLCIATSGANRVTVTYTWTQQ